MNTNRGFSLVELLVTLVILGAIAAVAVPTYKGYLTSSRQKIADTNRMHLQAAEESYYFEHNSYVAGSYGPNGADDNSLTTPLGWSPEGDGGKFKYTVTPCGSGTIATCYTITVVGFSGPNQVTSTYTRN